MTSQVNYLFQQPRDKLQSAIPANSTRCVMIAKGRVKNGVVVLEDAVRIAEGQLVTVLADPDASVRAASEGSHRHSVRDIPPISLGAVLRPLTADEDLLGEMLEDRS